MRKTCLDAVYEMAKKNKKIVFVGSDLGAGVLADFKKFQKGFSWKVYQSNI